jgi:hypothetical protein
MEPTQAAYIAGIMDGEGCFLIEKFATKASPIGFQFRASVQVLMCEYDTIKWIADLTDRHIQRKTLKSGRTAYGVVWRNSFAVRFIEQILPYLQGKKEQALILLDYEKNIAPGRGRTYKPESLALCEAAREKLFAIRATITPRC